jgi:hypothetical protein
MPLVVPPSQNEEQEGEDNDIDEKCKAIPRFLAASETTQGAVHDWSRQVANEIVSKIG